MRLEESGNSKATRGRPFANFCTRIGLVVAFHFAAFFTSFADPSPPTITVQPQSLPAALGSKAKFNVVADGTAPLSYQWQFKGANLPTATDDTLTIFNATFLNAGNYRVILSNACGSVTSSVATLSIITPPLILQQPVNAQVLAGSPALFKVVASSSGPLTYQWSRDDIEIPGATNATYNIAAAQLSDQGDYTVFVNNIAGSLLSSSAGLTVLASGSGSSLSTYSINLKPGLNLIANQLDTGGNNLNEIMPLVPDGTVASKYVNASGLWQQSTFTAAGGGWGPATFNLNPGEGAFIQVSSNYTLTFTGKPHVPVLPLSIPSGTAWLVSRQTNDIATYENIVGFPPSPGALIYKWDDSNANYVTYSFTSNGWSGGLAPSVAVGEAVLIAPSGGSPPPIPAAPAITQQPISLAVALGAPASFTVTASGTQPLSYQWQLNGTAIPGATSNVLFIASVQPANAGNYSVVVNNSIGSAGSTVAALTISNLNLLPFANNFSDAGDLGSATHGAGIGSNVGATLQPGEPFPLGVLIGASVWLRWQAPFDSLATFQTAGSAFDTLLGIYTGASLSNLTTVAADDDSAPSFCSLATFNAIAGTTYFIQVSGFHGVTGNIGLQWSVTPTTNPAPIILNQPQSQTVIQGSNLTLFVIVQPGPTVSYQWYSNYVALSGQTNAALTLSPAYPGLYLVAVTNTQTQAGLLSLPADVETIVADSGQHGTPTDVHGQDKFSDATELTPPDPNIIHDPPPAGSYTGTQDFTTVGTTTDPSEPAHCGYPPCATKWFSYQAPASGMLTIDTIGANFNAVLAIYTGPGDSYTTLVPVACSANHGSAGEKVSFAAISGTIYWVVVGGVSCATGSGTIHYNLTATPAFTLLPVSQTVTNGARVTLTASAVGAVPLGYQWRLNGNNIQGATSSSLVLANFQSASEGNYTVLANNIYGATETPQASVFANNPARLLGFTVTANQLSFQLVGIANTNYVIERSSNLVTWVPLKTNKSSSGIFNFSDAFTPGQNKFYRARKR